jgi:molybdopterin adenylyltransferase
MTNPLTVAILIVSDRAMTGERTDATGPALQAFLQNRAAQIVELKIVPDEKTQIAAALRKLCEKADLVLSAGGTGLAKRDVTPEATAEVIEKTVPGIAEAMRAAGWLKTPHALLSRGIAGTRSGSLILNLPGSPRGARESLEAVWEALPHAVAVLKGPVPEDSHRPQSE